MQAQIAGRKTSQVARLITSGAVENKTQRKGIRLVATEPSSQLWADVEAMLALATCVAIVGYMAWAWH